MKSVFRWAGGVLVLSGVLLFGSGCVPGDQAGTKPVSQQESLQHVPTRAPSQPGAPPPGVPGGPPGSGYPGGPPGGYPGGPPGGYPR